jgi:1-acyl-sn-glycerol-3-phosphate acyltransferase
MPIGSFKKGAFRMALDLGYPIVPVYFEGTTILSKGGSLLTKAGNITAHVYPSISTDHWNETTLEKNIEDIRNKYLQWSTVL